MPTDPLLASLLLVLVVSAGAALPLVRRWSHRGLHVFVSISVGIFLGTLFLHLLPELAAGPGHAPGAPADAHGEEGLVPLLPWMAALAGVLLLFVVERVWLVRASRARGHDPHVVLWSATFLGLVVHTFSTGLGLSVWLGEEGVGAGLLLSILLHKGTEAFSLATVMRLAGLPTPRAVLLIGVYALVAPAGLLLGSELAVAEGGLHRLLTGFAAGTFLYVALLDLLPEVFHGQERALPKLLSLLLGVALSSLSLERLQWLAALGGRVLAASLDVFVEMAPFLLAGFLVAGFLSQLLRPAWLARRLAKDDLRSVATASIVGAPLPLCSCSVLPVAAALRGAGASKGATSAFLIATPETGVDSVTVTWGLLGPVMTVVRPIGALLSALFTGGMVNLFVRRGLDREPAPPEAPLDPAEACAQASHAATGSSAPLVEACCEGEARPAASAEGGAGATRGGLLARALRYGFVDMLDDLAGPILVGVLLSGAISAVLPADLLAAPLGQGLPGMLLMLLVGIPIYVCASASTPIAAALLAKGLSPGAALVFLLASPATNLGSLYVIARYLGRRVVLVHVASLAAATLALGLATDALFGALGLEPRAVVGQGAHLVPPAVQLASAALLGLLFLVSLWRTRGGVHLLERLRRSEPGLAGQG